MSIRTSAKSIGNKDAQAAELSASIRKEWLKASPERKAEIRHDFMIGYIAGREKKGSERISLSQAEEIIETGKGKGASKAHIAMIDRAASGFTYHIVQGKTKKSEPQSSKRYSPELRKAAQAYLAKFDSVGEAIAVLRAVAK